MAETDNIIDTQPVGHQDENKTKVEIDADSGGDDYSSGSDRSFEAEDADNNRGDVEEERESQNRLPVAVRRKRRHGSHGSRRHKGGSRHKNRGFHPYNLDHEEELQLKRKSQELKEKENAAAVVRQEGESRFMNFPVAPFNSTQYLMDEHDSGSPAGMHKTGSSSKLSDEFLHSLASTPAEIQHEVLNLERKDKEFTDIYTTVHAESLQSLPKDELVKNYMSLEEKVAALQKKVAEAEQLKKQDDDSKVQDKQVDEISLIGSEISASGRSESSASSLSSNNEDFINLSNQVLSHPTISVGDVEMVPASSTGSSASSDSHIHDATTS
ncbi:protein hexim1 [Plakobranchus ocellatus]|uniref:Protein hexim1 n=1 Tax=Plakobranchus ocellatus TaxID=259542 RepID=A0AAV3ZFN3_9GAST|nr:protein hexim1 [Plakobranchus ocellatus]